MQEASSKFKKNRENVGNVLELVEDSGERATVIADAGLLDNRRFLLSYSPEARERLKRFKEVFEKFKADYPEVIGLTLYGSQTKGYANFSSDFDGYVFIDTDQAIKAFDHENIQEKDFISRYEFTNLVREQPGILSYEKRIKYAINGALSLKYERALNYYLGQRGITDTIGRKSLKMDFINEDYIQRCSSSDRKEDYTSDSLIALFHLSLATKDIKRYREILISAFESQGTRGIEKWNEFICILGLNEMLEGDDEELVGPNTHPERHKKLYPTLDKAREYFL